MPKKVKQKSQKSLKKSLLDQVETILNDSLKGLPKKISESKFKKRVQKVGKILIRSLATKPIKVASKSESKMPKKKKLATKPKAKVEAVS